MFKKITTLILAMIIFATASSVSVFGQAKLSDETQTVSQNIETNTDNLRKALAKNQSSSQNFDKKETLADYQKQNRQGNKFST